MEKWRRPALCRLCRFPAGADGVPVSRLDAGKLSRWWREALRTERNDDSTNAAEEFFCQFCLWDAKFLSKSERNQRNDKSCDWWLGQDTNKFYERFYFSEKIMRQCTVSIRALPDKGCNGSSEVTLAPREGAETKLKTWEKQGIVTRCHFCAEVFRSRSAAFQHMRQNHEDRSIICCNHCHLVFLSDMEKIEHNNMEHQSKLQCHICFKRIKNACMQQHISDFHAGIKESMVCCRKNYLALNQLIGHFLTQKPAKQKGCVYCKKKLASASSLHYHVKRYHVSEAIGCTYFHCVNYFCSQEEKKKHIAQVHESKSDLIECVYCNSKVIKFILPRHVEARHRSISFRCNFNNCLSYFHSEKEKNEHELKVHLATKVAPGIDCIYCDKKLDWIVDLHQHVKKKHKKVAIRCKIRGCGSYFLTGEDRDTHTLEKHAEEEAKRKWKCGTCDFRTNSEKNLIQHEMRHKPKNLQCPHCPKLCTAKRTLLMHINSDHPKATFCIHCKAEVHVKMWHHLRVRPCERCKLVTPCMGVKKAHMETCTEKWPRSRT